MRKALYPAGGGGRPSAPRNPYGLTLTRGGSRPQAPSSTVRSATEATAERASGNPNVVVDRTVRPNESAAKNQRPFTQAEAAAQGLPGFTNLASETEVLRSLQESGINTDMIPKDVLNSTQELLVFRPKGEGAASKVRFAVELEPTDVSEGGTVVFETSAEGTRIIEVIPTGEHLDVKPEEVLAYRAPGSATFKTANEILSGGSKPEASQSARAAEANQQQVANWRSEAKKWVKEHPGATTGGVLGLGGGGTGIGYAIKKIFGDDDASAVADPNVPVDPSPSGSIAPEASPSAPLDLGDLVYNPETGEYIDRGAVMQPSTGSDRFYSYNDPSHAAQQQQALIYYGQTDAAQTHLRAVAASETTRAAGELADRISKYGSLAWSDSLNDKLTAALANDLGRFIATLPDSRRRDLVTLVVVCALGGDSGWIVDHDSDFDLYKLITARLANPASVNGSMSFPEARQIAQSILSQVLLD